MSYDTLVDEVRARREAYAERFNHDLDAIIRDLKEQEAESGRNLVALPSRPVQGVESTARSKE